MLRVACADVLRVRQCERAEELDRLRLERRARADVQRHQAAEESENRHVAQPGGGEGIGDGARACTVALLPDAAVMRIDYVEVAPELRGSGLGRQLVEAAVMDGAGLLKIFLTLVVPVVKPGLMSLGLIVFLFAWQEYLLPLVVFQTESLKPLTVGAASLQGRYGVDYGGIAAAGLIAFAPLVVLFLAMQRSFVRGLTAGAVK